MNNIKKKSIILSVIVMLIGLMIVGGTFAYLTIQANVTNTNYVGVSTCFLVDYDIDNGDGTENITGTLFPSLVPVNGLDGRVGLKVKDECEVSGIGELKLHVNNTTSASLMQKATSHCEDKKTGDILTEYSTEASCSSANGKWQSYPTSYCEDKNTLQTLKEYTTQASCTSHNGNWVTNGSPLKYAVYNTNNTNGIPVSVGHITSSNIGNDVTIYDNIILTHEQRYFYVYIWIDGYLTDNSHADLPFDGYIKASATQNDRLLPNEYEEVEYLQSSGSQYIDTGVITNNNSRIKISFRTPESIPTNKSTVLFYSGGSGIGSYGFAIGSTTTNGKYRAFYRTTYDSSIMLETSRNYIVDFNKNQLYIDNSLIYTFGTGSFTSPFSMPILAQYYNTNTPINFAPNGTRIYSAQIFDNNELIRNFIPCYRKSDGVRGLYDTIGGKFYTNAGSGTFEIPT